jgi:hypothetical protein
VTSSAIDRALPRRPDYTLQLTLDTAQTLPFELWQTLRNEVWPGSPIEWTGTMPMMDWLATSRQLRWVLRDSANRRENMNVAWRFRAGRPGSHSAGERRAHSPSDAASDPSSRPALPHRRSGRRSDAKSLMEGHGAGPAGSTVDLLVEMTNPARGCCTVTSPNTWRAACT